VSNGRRPSIQYNACVPPVSSNSLFIFRMQYLDFYTRSDPLLFFNDLIGITDSGVKSDSISTLVFRTAVFNSLFSCLACFQASFLALSTGTIQVTGRELTVAGTVTFSQRGRQPPIAPGEHSKKNITW
jgi:hypothetical protein